MHSCSPYVGYTTELRRESNEYIKPETSKLKFFNKNIKKVIDLL